MSRDFRKAEFMIELGKVQELEVVRIKEFGVYLSEDSKGSASVLLPKKQVQIGRAHV